MDPLVDTTKGKILVVDDNDDLLDAMSLLLMDSGFEVLAAHHGGEALNKLQSEDRVALVVLDLRMPIMDGWEFLRHKKQQRSEIARIPVLVVSSMAAGSIKDAVGVLRKPVDPQQLIDTVNQHARNSRDFSNRN